MDLALRDRSIRGYWLTATSAFWLCALPVLLRKYSLPGLLRRTAVLGNRRKGKDFDLDRMVLLLGRLCRLRFFRLHVFPRDCLRQSLVLYRALNRLGYPATIHFGVRKKGGVFEGHSWVTLNNMIVGERNPVTSFTTVYSYRVQWMDERSKSEVAFTGSRG